MVVDVNMPEMDGFETTRALLEKYPQTKILAFSVNDGVKEVVKMLNCGAKGYILKGADPEELFSAIKIISDGKLYFSPVSEIVGFFVTFFSAELTKESTPPKTTNGIVNIPRKKAQPVW